MKSKAIVQEKRSISKMKFLAAFALTCLVFIAGIFIGSQITNSKVADILSAEQEARLQLENLELEEKLLEESPCMSPFLLSENLVDLGAKLTYLESEYSKNDPRILELKKPYTLLEIRHYLALKNMVEKCNQNYTFILFFYSNSPEKKDESEEQGFVLDYLKKKYESRLNIYSFDYDLDLAVMNVLKEIYNLKAAPSTVIDGKVYIGFHSKEELSEVLERPFNK